MIKISLQPHKKIYFASDFHLGVPSHEESLLREKKICQWLTSIQPDAQMIFLVGDIFDFWFEYRTVVPKGFVRLLGKLAELSDAGIEIIVFTGNHDMWMQGYFEKELGVKVFRKPQGFLVDSLQLIVDSDNLQPSTINSQPSTINSFYVAHGDGLGPGDYGYKLLKIVFESRFCRWAFGWLHPNLGIGLAHGWSGSRKTTSNMDKAKQFYGESGEWLFQYAKEIEAKQHHDFYIFGHRHLVLDMKVNETARYINLGEWFSGIDDCHYAVFDGKELSIVDN